MPGRYTSEDLHEATASMEKVLNRLDSIAWRGKIVALLVAVGLLVLGIAAGFSYKASHDAKDAVKIVADSNLINCRLRNTGNREIREAIDQRDIALLVDLEENIRLQFPDSDPATLERLRNSFEQTIANLPPLGDEYDIDCDRSGGEPDEGDYLPEDG